MATYTISPLSAPTRSLNIASSANISNDTQVNIYATSGSNEQLSDGWSLGISFA